MPAPASGEVVRTGTPDGTSGVKIFDVPLQEDSTYKAPAGVLLSDRIASSVSADRSGLSADDTGTTDMSTVGFAGSSGANLYATYNRGSLVVWCAFADSAGTATVEVVFYDAANAPLFVSEPLSFVAKTQRAAAAGNYLSQAQIVDAYGASKYRLFLRAKGTGNVDLYGHPV